MPSPGTYSQSEQHLHNAISDALESERQRLATHLRDNLISQANLIQAQINGYQTKAHPESQMAFSVLSTLIQQLMQEMYKLESNLNPSTLQSMGLAVAIESFANQQRRMTGANFTVNIHPNMKRLPLHIELALYRFLQEAIDDAITRRDSSQITINLEQENDSFILVILENGRYSVPEPGISIERIQSLGATIDYQESRYSGLETQIAIVLSTPIELTERETEVIQLLAEGLSNKEIAYQLDVKPRTIKFHLDNIYSKLNVSTRTEAAIYALQHGLTG